MSKRFRVSHVFMGDSDELLWQSTHGRYIYKTRTKSTENTHGQKAHTEHTRMADTFTTHGRKTHIKHARTEGIQHTMNVLIPDSARCPENSENNSCARKARPNFKVFFGKKFIFICILPVKFCVSNFVFQLADSHGNIRFSGKTAIYADFSWKPRFKRIFCEIIDLRGCQRAL